MRRAPSSRLAALVAAGALLCGVALAAPAAAQDAGSTGDGLAPAGVGPDTWTVTATTVTSTNGPDDDQTVDIDVDLWVPSSASSASPVPALVAAHGFGGNKANAELRTIAAYFASHGYLVATMSHQGFGQSTGCISLDSIDEDAKNVRAVVDLLATRDDVATEAPGDPRVGMVGGSYGGGHQVVSAVLDDRLDALAPGRTWNSLAYALVPNNWVVPGTGLYELTASGTGVFKQQWTSLFFVAGSSQPADRNGGCDPITQQTLYPGSPPCPGFVPAVCPTFANLTATGTPSEADFALVSRSAADVFIDEIDVPVMWSQGLPDALFTPTEAAASHQRLVDRDVPSAMFWHSSGHGGYLPAPGDGEPYNGIYDETPEQQAIFASSYWARRHLAWFDRWVREDATVDTGPTFAWFRDHVTYDPAASGGSSVAAYGTADAVPDPADGVALFLAGDQLVADAPGETADVSMVLPPGGVPASYTRTSNFQTQEPFASIPTSDPPGQALTFTGQPLDAPLEVVGVPTITIPLAQQNPGQDAVVFAKLVDVAPDGTAAVVRRLVAPSRVPGDQLDAPVTLRLPAVAHRFEAGHAVQVVLATTDAAFKALPLPDQLTVTTGPDAVLRLPTPAAPAAAPVPVDEEPAPGPVPAPAVAPPLPATGGGSMAAGLGLLSAGLALAGRRRGVTRG